MAKQILFGVDGIARNVTSPYIGVNGVARTLWEGYIGVDGVAKQFLDVSTRYKKTTSTTTYTSTKVITLPGTGEGYYASAFGSSYVLFDAKTGMYSFKNSYYAYHGNFSTKRFLDNEENQTLRVITSSMPNSKMYEFSIGYSGALSVWYINMMSSGNFQIWCTEGTKSMRVTTYTATKI